MWPSSNVGKGLPYSTEKVLKLPSEMPMGRIVTPKSSHRVLGRDNHQVGQEGTRRPAVNPQWRLCEACGRGPTIVVRLRPTGGLRYIAMRPPRPLALCKECGIEVFRDQQTIYRRRVAALIFTAPYSFAQNQKWIERLKRLPDPAEPTVRRRLSPSVLA